MYSTITALLISYTPIQKQKFKIKKSIYMLKIIDPHKCTNLCCLISQFWGNCFVFDDTRLKPTLPQLSSTLNWQSIIENKQSKTNNKRKRPLVFTLTCIRIFVVAAAAAKWLWSCSTLCDPIDGSPQGSPVPGILQARTLE